MERMVYGARYEHIFWILTGTVIYNVQTEKEKRDHAHRFVKSGKA